jgi:hypothetical protein
MKHALGLVVLEFNVQAVFNTDLHFDAGDMDEPAATGSEAYPLLISGSVPKL